ncbi:hypothetical protein GGR95_001209 [Sulfitobacter undariae]|uniref:Uncharacterized protein n=1 Tax=Sulfitobacter undariae TaxID=1563671 RepID=A0A7W6E2K5_9RHOB|nr:hypothetical protein [Sulfitobacter undariae]MBB3993578.1 hypothetical protein [Sulfitobacter undariae]
MYLKLTILGLSCLAISACSSPADFETAPVQVDTPQGAVTCQLYTQSITAWDRSINRPDKMTTEAADAICRNEGLKRK